MTLKLKQKLAIEYVTLTESKNLEITEAYIAGFDRALVLTKFFVETLTDFDTVIPNNGDIIKKDI